MQGCFNTTSFDKNYWHLNFAINVFCSSFPPLLHTLTFFAIPFAEKMHPFFRQPSTRKSSFPLSSLLQFLLLLNKYANYLYRRNWNLPINPVRPSPWFYGGERQIVRLATPVLWLFPLTSQHLDFQFSTYFNFQILLEVVAIKRKNCRDGSRHIVFCLYEIIDIVILLKVCVSSWYTKNPGNIM